MDEERLRSDTIIEELLAGDAPDDLREVTAFLVTLRSEAELQVPPEPDNRLRRVFDKGRRRAASWPALRRPAVAFTATFLAVLALGTAALAFAALRDSGPAGSTPTTAAAAPPATEALPVAVALPPETEPEIGAYLTCALGETTAYLARRLGEPALFDRPRVLTECGLPALPFLGPEAEEFRSELNEWLACTGEAFEGFGDSSPRAFADLENLYDEIVEGCGAPPDPGDFGISIDGDALYRMLEDLDLPDLPNLPNLDELQERLHGLQDELREAIPDLQLPELDLEGLRDRLDSLRDQRGEGSATDRTFTFRYDREDGELGRLHMEFDGTPLDVDLDELAGQLDDGLGELESLIDALHERTAGDGLEALPDFYQLLDELCRLLAAAGVGEGCPVG